MDKYSDPDYAKHVELQAYLMTPEQVAELFASNPNEVLEFQTFHDISKMWEHSQDLFRINLVIRIKNKGSKAISGELEVEPNLGGINPVQLLWISSNQEEYLNLVRPVTFGGVNIQDAKIDTPLVSWKSLFTKLKGDQND